MIKFQNVIVQEFHHRVYSQDLPRRGLLAVLPTFPRTPLLWTTPSTPQLTIQSQGKALESSGLVSPGIDSLCGLVSVG